MDSGGTGPAGSGRGAAWTNALRECAHYVQKARERQAHLLPRTHILPFHNSIGEAVNSSLAGQ